MRHINAITDALEISFNKLIGKGEPSLDTDPSIANIRAGDITISLRDIEILRAYKNLSKDDRARVNSLLFDSLLSVFVGKIKKYDDSDDMYITWGEDLSGYVAKEVEDHGLYELHLEGEPRARVAEFARNLREKMKANGLDVPSLAERSGISESDLSNVLAEKPTSSGIDIVFVVRLAVALGCPLKDLIRLEEAKEGKDQ